MVGFEVLTAMVMKSSIFWDIPPWSTLKVNRRFGGTSRLHLQGRRISLTEPACHQLSSRFLLGLFIDPKNGGDMLLWNVNWFSTDFTALCPKRYVSSCYKIFQRISTAIRFKVNAHYYAATSCCSVYNKLALAFLSDRLQLSRSIKIYTSIAFVSSYYSNATCFGPTGCHHQVYKL
jgi:hypothetical protein